MLQARGILIELKSALEMLSKGTARTFGEDSLLSQNLHPCHVVVFFATIFADSKGTAHNALNLTF